jgi:hypothetical protein
VNPLAVPPEIARCPHCGEQIYLDVEEWDAETGQPTEEGCSLVCATLNDLEVAAYREGPGSAAVEAWAREQRHHSAMPYVHMLPVAVKVYEQFGQHCRVRHSPDGETVLVYEAPPLAPDEQMRRAGAPMLPGMEP